MKRLVVITVGKTHSGKTTFARMLEKQLTNSVVIDQDSHAEFIHNYYQKLLPTKGPNTFKYTLTQTIVNYAIHKTDRHLILCNSNRYYPARIQLLNYFREQQFTTVLVYFDLPKSVLETRVKHSKRSTNILRSAKNFDEVLERQQNEEDQEDLKEPQNEEANYLFVIKKESEVPSVIKTIKQLSD